MKKTILAVLFMTAYAYRMADDAPAAPDAAPDSAPDAAPVDTAPTKETILARVEAFFERGEAKVAEWLHDALNAVETMFNDDDASVEVTTGDEDAGNAATGADASPVESATTGDAPTTQA